MLDRVLSFMEEHGFRKRDTSTVARKIHLAMLAIERLTDTRSDDLLGTPASPMSPDMSSSPRGCLPENVETEFHTKVVGYMEDSVVSLRASSLDERRYLLRDCYDTRELRIHMDWGARQAGAQLIAGDHKMHLLFEHPETYNSTLRQIEKRLPTSYEGLTESLDSLDTYLQRLYRR